MNHKQHVEMVRKAHGCGRDEKPIPPPKTVPVRGHYRTVKERASRD